MKFHPRLERCEKRVNSVSNVFSLVSSVALVVMLLLGSVDFIGAKLFNLPVPGAVEMTGLLGLVIASFAIAFTQVLQGHTSIDFLVNRLPKRSKAVIASIVSLFGLVLFALIVWQMYSGGRTFQTTGRITSIVHIPLAPFAYAIAVCCLLTCLVLLVTLVRSIKGVVK